MLKSFNDDSTKREVCKQIKTFEGAIEEESSVPGSQDNEEDGEANKT